MKTGDFIKIQDGTIIKRSSLSGYHRNLYDPNGCHSYIALYNKKTKAFSMYPTSHYVDPKKQTDVKKGRAILMKLKGANGYSTVYKLPRTKDVHGHYFSNTFNSYEHVGELSSYQLNKFKRFVKKKK